MIAEDSPAQGNVPDNVVCKSINEVQCSEEVMLLTDKLWQYPKDSYHNNTITVIAKQSARELHDDFPPSCLEFHLQSIQSSFISWEGDESKRMLIRFTDVVGLEVRENLIVMDVKYRPKFERNVHTKARGNAREEVGNGQRK